MRVLAERFEIVAQLGRGAMGAVYRARDRVRSEDVALKVLPALDATALLRFKNEFRALHDVQHPNLVRLHELHEDQGTWFFTMQLVDGIDLLSWVAGDEVRVRSAFAQVARALQRLHHDGLVHRDVKPSNVLVTPTGEARLLDFGLITAAWSPGEGAGTPAYMAPEQIAGHVSPAADWYAVGALLFHALTDRLPFVGSGDETLHAKLERDPPRVRDVAPHAPADLAALADALLAREPRDRPSGDTVLATLGARREPLRVASTILVGRDRELAQLRDAVAQRMAGEAVAVAVIGESGIGKTALLRAFAEEAELDGRTWVLGGRCWERESVPYKGFDGVFDELAAKLEGDELVLADAGWSALLAQAFPVLRRLPAFAELSAHETVRDVAARLSSGVRWLLAEVAAKRPLIVVLDDLQWADRDTLTLLRALIEPPLPNVLVVIGAREPVAIESRAAITTVALAPLSHDDTCALVQLVARELGRSVDPEAIARETRGHPLFAAELAHYAIATGELAAFEHAVQQTTARLGDAAQRLATLVSLAHAPIAIEVAAHATGDPPATLFEALAQLRAARILATTGVGSATRLEPYHDRIRNVLTAPLEPPDVRMLHGKIAEALETTTVEDPAALALHWQHAGQPAAAARHALRAAEQADATLAFHRAAHLYTWVLELDPTIPNLRARQAEALAQAGLGVAAADAFLACARDATGADAIDLRRRAMQQLLIMGHSTQALALFDELMRELGLPNPTHSGRILLGLLRRRAAVRMHRPRLPPPSTTQLEPMLRARLDVVWDGAVGLAFADPLRSFYLQALDLDMCFRAGDSHRIARALTGEAAYLAVSRRHSRRLEQLLALTDEAAVRTGYPSLPHFMRGIVAFMFGQWRDARDLLALGERLLLQERPKLVKEAFGPAAVLDQTRRLMLAAMFFLGELRPLAERTRVLLQDAIERNDVMSATHQRTGIQSYLHLAFDDVDSARWHAEEGFRPWREARIGVPYFMDTQARIAIDTYTGDAEAAHRHAVEAWPRLVRAQLLRLRYINASMLDCRGRAAVAAALVVPDRRRDYLADAKRCADALARIDIAWTRAHAEAIRAAAALAIGNTAARDHLARAASGFAGADMTLHAAIARLAQAERTEDAVAAGAARRVLSDAGVVDVDRYSRLWLPRATT